MVLFGFYTCNLSVTSLHMVSRVAPPCCLGHTLGFHLDGLVLVKRADGLVGCSSLVEVEAGDRAPSERVGLAFGVDLSAQELAEAEVELVLNEHQFLL